MLRCLLFATLLIGSYAEKRYDGYKVFRITPRNDDELDTTRFLKQYLKKKVEFWKSPSRVGSPVDMLVEPNFQHLVIDIIKESRLDFEVTVNDLQRDIDDERSSVEVGFDYEDFNTLEDIHTWMTDFANANPSLVSIINVGSSYEGRTIKAFKIGANGASDKNAVWYEGGIHAREWISPATLIYMCKLLVEGYGVDSNVTTILDNLDVFMLPVYNVDGYHYTWSNDRMWRKTRSDNPDSSCTGTDPNRNWDYEWGGSSNWGCSDSYQGPRPHSEIEVRTVTSYIKSLGNKVKAFIDFHSYGQLWMTPWGYTRDLPVDYDDHVALGTAAANALQAVYGTTYSVGNIADIIYVATGSSADWGYGAAGIKYSYGVELRGDSFIIDRAHIKPSGIETFEALKVISLFVI